MQIANSVCGYGGPGGEVYTAGNYPFWFMPGSQLDLSGKSFWLMKQCFFQTHGGIIQRAFYAHSLNVYLICILVLLYTVQMAGAEENHEKKLGPTAEMVKFCKLM